MKKGDRVVCVNKEEDTDLVVGKEYEILEIIWADEFVIIKGDIGWTSYPMQWFKLLSELRLEKLEKLNKLLKLSGGRL